MSSNNFQKQGKIETGLYLVYSWSMVLFTFLKISVVFI